MLELGSAIAATVLPGPIRAVYSLSDTVRYRYNQLIYGDISRSDPARYHPIPLVSGDTGVVSIT